MNDGNIEDFQKRLSAKMAEKEIYFSQLDCAQTCIGILAEAIKLMRETGADEPQISTILYHAAGELS